MKVKNLFHSRDKTKTVDLEAELSGNAEELLDAFREKDLSQKRLGEAVRNGFREIKMMITFRF